MRRRDLITLLGAAAAVWPLAARAQQAGPTRRVGVLMNVGADDPEGQSRIAAFTQGLRDLGWTETRNIRFDYRWASDDQGLARTYAAELVRSGPDVILASATPMLAALRQATQAIPLVFVQVSDPVGQGFVESLARPGGNITGFANFEFSMVSKWLELLKQLVPGVRRVALMFNPETAPYGQLYLEPLNAAARSIGVESIVTRVRSDADVERTIADLAQGAKAGLIVLTDTFLTVRRAQIISLAARYRIAAIYPYRYYAQSGGLLSYGSDTADLFRRSAAYVDRILKGARPAELPVQQPTKFELVINLETAKALGLTVPPTLLALADEVIE
jgi:putative tryptophan/tyrosine transport system substrate-binding protein